MKDQNFLFTPLGGGLEIGANSYYFEWDDVSFLIDAGGHPDAPGYLALPEFYRIRKLDFVLITHAHQDHVGSLPYLHKIFPDVPVYMTEETLSIAKIMLYDSLKFVRASRSVEGYMMYTRSDVDSLLVKIETISRPFLKNSIRITPYDSGHILGSVGFILEKNNRVIVFTSDTSLEKKATSRSINLADIKADLIISESTYGRSADKTSPPDRSHQYAALINMVKKIINAGGSIIFPAFVIERAQEILLIINQAVKDGQIPDVPIFLAGLAIPLTELHAKYLKLDFAFEVISREEMEFLNSEEDGPYILITGSGMMNVGSSSSLHAEHLLAQQDNAVIFTGYCAPGTAGFRLLNNNSDRFYMNGHFIPIRTSNIHQFHISCHATGKDLVEIINHFNPENIILIHGDDESIHALDKYLKKNGYDNIYTPGNSDTVRFGTMDSSLGESVRERKELFYKLLQEEDYSACRKLGSEILSDRPWDLEMLEVMSDISEQSIRAYYERKYYVILKMLCEKEMIEGNIDLADYYLSLLGETFSNRYIERNRARIRKLKKRSGMDAGPIKKLPFYKSNQDYKNNSAGYGDNNFSDKTVIGKSNQLK